MTKLQRITAIILSALLIISIIIGLAFYLSLSEDELGVVDSQFTGTILSWAYVLFGIAAIVTIVFSFVGIFTSTNGLKNALISIGAAVVLFGVSFALGSGNPVPGLDDTSATTLKWVDTGLIATYILAGVAFVGIIASEVTRAFK